MNKLSSLSFVIPDPAKGKARPRVTRGGLHTFTPDPGGWAANATAMCRQAVNESDDWAITEEPITMLVHITRRMVTQWSKKRKLAELNRPAMRTPDLVNVLANICDACQGVAYVDDKQITHIEASHWWGLEAKTQVTLKIDDPMEVSNDLS